MKKIAVLISGSGSNLEAIAEACRANRINGKIVCVISNNPDAYGIKRAQKFNLQSVVIDHNSFASRTEFENEIENSLDNYDVDLIVLAGFMRILGENITKKYFPKNSGYKFSKFLLWRSYRLFKFTFYYYIA